VFFSLTKILHLSRQCNGYIIDMEVEKWMKLCLKVVIDQKSCDVGFFFLYVIALNLFDILSWIVNKNLLECSLKK